MNEPILMLRLARHGHVWYFAFNPAHCGATLQVAAKWAADARLPFTWQDANEVSQAIRQVR